MSKFLKALFEQAHDLLFAWMVRSGLILPATDTILTISMITNEALMVLENELVFTKLVNRNYEDQFAIDGAKIGDTVNVRRPAQFRGTSGPALAVEDFYESSIPVVVGDITKYGDQFHVDTTFTTKDMRLSLGDFSDRVIKPAVATVANKVDFDGQDMAKNWTSNIVGTAGTIPTDLLTFMTANSIITSEAGPTTDRNGCLDPFSMATITNALKGLFAPQAAIGSQYMKGQVGRAVGFDWYESQNVRTHGFGFWDTSASTLTADTTSIGIATGWAQTSTITLTHGASLTLKKGDVIRIANVFPVNPQNRQIYGTTARPFVVQTEVSGTGSSTMSVTVAPAIITAGQFQNVSITATSATATVTPFNIGTSATGVNSPQNIIFHKNAFTCVMVDLPLPGGVDMGARASSKKAGLSMRIVRQYTINNDQLPSRVEVLYGWAPLYSLLATRVAS